MGKELQEMTRAELIVAVMELKRKVSQLEGEREKTREIFRTMIGIEQPPTNSQEQEKSNG